MRKVRVPADRQAFRTEPEIAIEEIDRIKGAGVRFGCVLADAGYGLSAPFRQAINNRLRPYVGAARQGTSIDGDALVVPRRRGRLPLR